MADETPYDSTQDTWDHIWKVRRGIEQVERDLLLRGKRHDESKLVEPEKSVFDKFSPLLATTEYDSDEYKAHLVAMKEGALDHHYAVNDHHPEHFQGPEAELMGGGPEIKRSAVMQGDGAMLGSGIHGMNLVQMIEMLCDWKAATERMKDGSLTRSIEINQKRYGYGDEIKNLLTHTASYFGWLD